MSQTLSILIVSALKTLSKYHRMYCHSNLHMHGWFYYRPSSFVFFPFGLGHRSCIGKHFALVRSTQLVRTRCSLLVYWCMYILSLICLQMEAKMILARLIQTYTKSRFPLAISLFVYRGQPCSHRTLSTALFNYARQYSRKLCRIRRCVGMYYEYNYDATLQFQPHPFCAEQLLSYNIPS